MQRTASEAWPTMSEFYCAFDAWASNATGAAILAILESDADVRAMTVTAFDVSTSSSSPMNT